MPVNTNQPTITCFEPIVDGNTKILILGTLPGPESIATSQYYASPKNGFWKIIFALYGQRPPVDYGEKCAFLLQHNIGIWDVLGSADREGFEDANIENAVPNNFIFFIKRHPKIQGLIFNGKGAENEFLKAFPVLYNEIRHELVLSSSGSLARTFFDKADSWKATICNP